MLKNGYSRSLFLTDLGLVLVSCIITFCLGLTTKLDEPAISWFFQFILYLLDFSIMLAVEVTIYMKDGVVVFHLYRLVGLLFAQNFGMAEVMLWPVIGLVIFRTANLAANYLTGLSTVGPKEEVEGEQWWQRQFSRRCWSVCILALVTFLTVTLCTLHRYGNMTVPVLTLFLLLFLAFEMRLLLTSEDDAGRLIANSLRLNVIIYLGICSLFGSLYHGRFEFFFEECVLYLGIAALVVRAVIGSQSWKFHKDDKELFEAVYQFSTQAISKRYRHKDIHKRLIKTLDRVSRIMVYAVYFLACIVAAGGSHYLWLLAALLLLRAYPLENSSDDPFHFLEQFTGVKVRALITIPFLLLSFTHHSKTLCKKDVLYGTVTGCDSYNNCQFWSVVLMAVYVWLCQFISSREKRMLCLKFSAYLCPVLIVMMVYGYECQTAELVLLTFYCLALAFEIVRDDRLAMRKDSKKE